MRFQTSPRRKEILEGLLKLRREFIDLGISGFQWLSGSFMEDIETHESRDPNDIDVVTFVVNPAAPAALGISLTPSPHLLNPSHIKANYSVDHFLVPLGSNPELIVDSTRYWYGLFSHRRDRVWKGMLVTKLGNAADDAPGRAILGMAP